MRRLCAALVALLLAMPVLVAPAEAGCALRRRGPWTAAAPPVTTDQVALHNGPLLVAPAGPAGSAFLARSGDVLGSTDRLCSWRTSYTMDAYRNVPDVVVLSMAGVAGSGARTYALLTMAELGGVGFWFHSAGVAPFVVAVHEGDVWRTSLVTTPTAAGPAAPVLGNGWGARIVVAPSDSRVAYATLGVRDMSNGGTLGAIYVTRDAGVSWSFVAWRPGTGPVAIDPLDPNLLYVATSSAAPEVYTLSTRAPVQRRTVLRAGSGTISAIDVLHTKGRPARLAVSVSHLAANGAVRWDVHRSDDGARTWRRLALPLGIGDDGSTFASGGVWLAADGGMVGVANTWLLTKPTGFLLRYDARRGVWRREPLALPYSKGYERADVASFVPADATRRTFLYVGTEWSSSGGGIAPIAGTFDASR